MLPEQATLQSSPEIHLKGMCFLVYAGGRHGVDIFLDKTDAITAERNAQQEEDLP